MDERRGRVVILTALGVEYDAIRAWVVSEGSSCTGPSTSRSMGADRWERINDDRPVPM
jgi:hypothetical protein